MFKKLMLLAVSVAALVAFAVPAVASADPIITDSASDPAHHVTAVSENTVSVTNGGQLECETVTLTLDIDENDTETAHGEGTGTASGSDKNHSNPCRVLTPDPVPLTITSINQTVHLNDDGTGKATFHYTFLVAHFIPCTVHGTADVNYTDGSNTLSLANGTLTGPGGGGCPTEGVITGDFHVTDTAGEPVEFMATG